MKVIHDMLQFSGPMILKYNSFYLFSHKIIHFSFDFQTSSQLFKRSNCTYMARCILCSSSWCNCILSNTLLASLFSSAIYCWSSFSFSYYRPGLSQSNFSLILLFILFIFIIKSLKLSNSAKQGTATGEIVNLVNNSLIFF